MKLFWQNKRDWVTFNFLGGVVSVHDLNKLALSLHHLRGQALSLSTRQQIIARVPLKKTALEIEKYVSTQLPHVQAGPDCFVMSSMVSCLTGHDSSWLDEEVFLEFFYELKAENLKNSLSFTSTRQNLVNSFSASINVVASKTSNFWQIMIKNDWLPLLISSHSLVQVISFIDQYLANERNQQGIQEIAERITTIWPDSMALESLPVMNELPGLPYLEGFHQTGETFFLGLALEKYDLLFIDDLCRFLRTINVSSLFITSYASFIIPNIDARHIPAFSEFLEFHEIDTNQGWVKTYWQFDPTDRLASSLRQNLIKVLQGFEGNLGPRALGVQTERCSPETRFIIGQRGLRSYFLKFKTEDDKYHLKRSSLKKLVEALAFNKSSQWQFFAASQPWQHVHAETVYRCPSCGSEYNEDFGAECIGIKSGTLFIEIKDETNCFLCQASMANYEKFIFSPLVKT